MNWKIYFQNKVHRNELIITLILLAVILFFFPKFLQFVETREGVILPDPLLSFFKPINLTWLTFGLIYLSLIIAVIVFVKDPNKIVITLQCYGLMVIFRSIAMYSMPLEAPLTLIPLNDPFVQLFGTGQILEKDLFFSGHTATLFLLYLITDNKKLKMVFLISTLFVAVSVLLQHVHYTVDVIAAPFFSFASYKIVIYFRQNFLVRKI